MDIDQAGQREQVAVVYRMAIGIPFRKIIADRDDSTVVDGDLTYVKHFSRTVDELCETQQRRFRKSCLPGGRHGDTKRDANNVL